MTLSQLAMSLHASECLNSSTSLTASNSTSPLDFCRVMWQYSPFRSPSHQYEKWVTILHPVVYDIVLGVLKLICVMYLILFIRKQYKAIQQSKQEIIDQDMNLMMMGQPQSQSVLIFPLYLRILIFLAILSFYQALVDLLFPLQPNPKFRNPIVNSIVHAIGSGFEHATLEGVAVLLIFQGVGKRTTIRTLLIALVWGIISGSLSAIINIFSWKKTTVFITILSWTSVMFIFYLLLWLLPLTSFHRRPAIISYARIFTFFHAISILSHVLTYFKLAAGFCTLHLTQHGIIGVIIPYLIYSVLINDSKYWQGMSGDDNDDEYNPNLSQSNQDDSVQGALVGITFNPKHARHVAKQMDKTSRVNMISFAAIRLEKNLTGSGPKHIILGAGSSARVYRGLLYDRRVAIKTILCLELTQDVISSFYREAALLTKLRHNNIVAVEGMCVNPPALCLVMELCGGSLMDLLSAIYNNAHTAATNQLAGGRNSGRQSTGGNNNMNGNGQIDNNGKMTPQTPYFSYYTDTKSSAFNSKLRRKQPLQQQLPTSNILDINSNQFNTHHSTINTNSTPQSSSFLSNGTYLPGSHGSQSSLSMGSSLISSQSGMSLVPSPQQNIPLLLTPHLIPEYYDMDAVHTHPIDFWKELLRCENPTMQEFTRPSTSTPTSLLSPTNTSHNNSPSHTPTYNNMNNNDIPIPISLNPNDTILSWLSRIELMLQCSTSVAFLHQQQPPILHLDIKSSNFLLGFDGRVKLADLELSRHIAMTTKDGDITSVPTNSTQQPNMSNLNNTNNNNNGTNSGNTTPKTGPNMTPSISDPLSLARSPTLQLINSNSTNNTTTTSNNNNHSPNNSFKSPTLSNLSPSTSFTSSTSTTPPIQSLLSPSITSQQQLQSSFSQPTRPTYSTTIPPSTAFLIDLLSEIVTNGPTHLIAHEMAYRSQFNGITIPERVNWLAPELMLGHRYSEKVDVYALGCVLYEIVTGKVPFYDLELQLKQLVTLPRGVSSYYQRSGSNNNSSSSSNNNSSSTTNINNSVNTFYSTNNDYDLIHQQPINSHHQSNTPPTTASQLLQTTSFSTSFTPPKSSTFVNPRSKLNTSTSQQQSLINNKDNNNNNNQNNNGKNNNNNTTNNQYNTFFDGPKQPPITTTPTTEQIQAAIKVLVAIYHYRPHIPIDTPKIIRDLIEQSWHPDPSRRPSCQHISQVLTQIKFDLLKDGGLQHIY